MASTTQRARTTSNRQEGQAAAAALFVSNEAASKHSGQSILDADGKLSSASAATSLKYAKAQDLPSFPSAGLKLSSAGAAASLADSNKRAFEHWKPGTIPAANKAALLAKDYEMDPLWQPELSAAGSKAALLAHRDTTTIEPYKAPTTDEGHSAAGQALRVRPTTKDTAREIPADVHQKALMAAAGAMAGSRPRAGSAPNRPVDDKSWALKAATKSHKTPVGGAFASGDPGFEASRIQNLAKSNVNRQLYGSAPPVDIEVEEKNRQDTLRASAVAMAQKMYAIQQSHLDEAASGAKKSDSRSAALNTHQRTVSSASGEMSEQAVPHRYENLEEAARRLAQERLAKLHDEHAEYRQYYGAPRSPPRSRLSMRLGRRASTGSDGDSDEEQSRKIRQQMSLFQSQLAAVDNKKRQADRDKLLEIAHRNVEKRMSRIDDRVFQETGKASPAQKEMWERQARERAQAQIEEATKNYGKVHIGGGKYLDQSEVDAIAKARLQPTLDEIDDKVAAQRKRDEEIRARQAEALAEQERVKDQAARDKARDAEVKAELKAQQDQIKREEKVKREEEKRLQKEQAVAEKERARMQKEENRKSVRSSGFFSGLRHRSGSEEESKTLTTDEAPATVTAKTGPALESTVHDVVTVPTADSEQRSDERPVRADIASESPDSSSKRDSKVRSWFKSHLRGSSKAHKDELPTEATTTDADKTRDDSIRDVAMAGRSDEAPSAVAPARAASAERSPSITSVSSSEPPKTTEAAADESDNVPQSEKDKGKGLGKLFSKLRSNKDSDEMKQESTNRASGSDEYQEARDTFDDSDIGKAKEKSVLPTPHHVVGDGAGSIARPGSSSHERSRFTEEL